jgi:RND superfamily putative drug exporter
MNPAVPTRRLMGRAREEVASLGHRRGVLRALTATGGVITSAGLVLAATFSALMITPVVLNIQLGAVVVAGVLIDTFIVRSLLVPAMTLDAGARTWWPSRPAAEGRPEGGPQRDGAGPQVPAGM